MIESEGWPVGVGNSFELEVAIARSCNDRTSQETHMEDIAELVSELSESNPYVGQKVIVYTAEPLKLVSIKDGSAHTLFAGDGLVVTLEGFHAETEVTEDVLYSELGVELSLEYPGLEDFIAHTPAENILHIELNDSSHPFIHDQDMLELHLNRFDEMKRLYPHADSEEYADYVIADLEARSRLMGCEVELLICELAEIGLRRDELIPNWADPFDEAVDEVEFDNLRMAADFRGKFKGVVVGYESVYDDEEMPTLGVILALDPDNSITDDTAVRYAYIDVSTVSWGRVISGPAFN